MKADKISIVSPIYAGEAMLPALVARVSAAVTHLAHDHEIILVEDHGPDEAWTVLRSICEQNKRVKGIRLSRNFGQHYAITAGLEASSGDWVVVMDCDLQDIPEEIPKLYHKAQEGYQIVFARREVRHDSWPKKMGSRLFYRLFGYLTDTRQDPAIANFGIYSRKAIDAVLSMGDHIRYFPTMSQWVGFRKTAIDVRHGHREEGESSYSWSKLLKLAFNNIIAFSNKPLKLIIRFGFVVSLASGLIGLYYLIKYLSGGIVVAGYSSLIISIWFLSGVIISILGIVGIYLGKAFDRVKDRPTYIVDEHLNLD